MAGPIGVFDSGVGGLTVVRAITSALPGERIVYFGDTARVPYGIKGPETIRRYAEEDLDFLLRFKPKMVVVACNTVSATALEHLAARTDVPIVGVIDPGAMAAAKASKTGRIGVIGTEATIASKAYEKAIQRVRPDARVISKACPLFVPMVEEGRVDGEIAELVVQEYVGGLVPLGADTLVLGCTHYPILKPIIAAVTGGAFAIVDSAEETANAVKLILSERSLANGAGRGGVDFYASDNPERFRRLATLFLGSTPCGVTLVQPEEFFSTPETAAKGGV